MYLIYVAIGQKRSTVAQLVQTLEEEDALSVIVTATAYAVGVFQSPRRQFHHSALHVSFPSLNADHDFICGNGTPVEVGWMFKPSCGTSVQYATRPSPPPTDPSSAHNKTSLSFKSSLSQATAKALAPMAEEVSATSGDDILGHVTGRFFHERLMTRSPITHLISLHPSASFLRSLDALPVKSTYIPSVVGAAMPGMTGTMM